MTQYDATQKRPRVALFVSCLVDFMRPSIGFACVKILRDAGCDVDVPNNQSCCGQIAFNNGDQATAKQIAIQVVQEFTDYDYIVVPSGSCAAMLKYHYAELLKPQHEAGIDFGSKVYELCEFLVDVLAIKEVSTSFLHDVSYHDSCSSLRELGIKQQPRALLKSIAGLKFNEMQDTEVCCGFGGTFCVKYGDIATHMVDQKLENIANSKCDTLIGNDLGCLLNIAGRAERKKMTLSVYHIAEVLADMTNETPSISTATSVGAGNKK